jgi:hypothetical protein
LPSAAHSQLPSSGGAQALPVATACKQLQHFVEFAGQKTGKPVYFIRTFRMTQPFEAQLSSCLQNAQSLDKNTREQAEAYIRRVEEENWGAFLLALSQELARDEGPEISRQMAGLLLKNSLDAKDSHIQVSSCVAIIGINATGSYSYGTILGVSACRLRRHRNGRL